MKENSVEKYLVAQVKKLGGVCVKLSTTHAKGIPDRLCVLPNIAPFLVELKTANGKLSPIQELKIQQLQTLGAKVYVLNSYESINETLKLVYEIE